MIYKVAFTLNGSLLVRKVMPSTSRSQKGNPLQRQNECQIIMLWLKFQTLLNLILYGKPVIYPWLHSAWIKGPMRRIAYMPFFWTSLMNFAKSYCPTKLNCSSNRELYCHILPSWAKHKCLYYTEIRANSLTLPGVGSWTFQKT